MSPYGKTLIIEAKTLISEDIRIETFPENAKALLGVEGSSGGEILIKAQTAKGKLHVVMRGEHGGDAVEPEPLGVEGKGARGQDAKSGKKHCFREPFALYEMKRVYEDTNPHKFEALSRPRECVCVGGKEASHGKKGKKVLKGIKV